MKQTTVEWLIERIINGGIYTKEMLKDLEQAKEMEKQQIINARISAPQTTGDIMLDKEEAEYYINETYGGNK
jgi:hypothetical protein